MLELSDRHHSPETARRHWLAPANNSRLYRETEKAQGIMRNLNFLSYCINRLIKRSFSGPWPLSSSAQIESILTHEWATRKPYTHSGSVNDLLQTHTIPVCFRYSEAENSCHCSHIRAVCGINPYITPPSVLQACLILDNALAEKTVITALLS